MKVKFEPIILCRNENGRFAKQIQLGENFLSDINKMSTDIFQIKGDFIQIKN